MNKLIERQMKEKLINLSKKYPIVTLTGPRQSGKTTLAKSVFPEYKYVSLEDIDMREYAEDDPRGFLSTYNDRTIIDEAQKVPSLFSYLQTHVDKENKEGMYILTGSHNFLMLENISQSLSGRTAILNLLPLSHSELVEGDIKIENVDEEIFKGGYPRIYDKNIDPVDYYPYYIETYVERDVRMIKNIENLSQFVKFIRLAAGRIGQLLNLTSLANECGISTSTASSWISTLEASFILYRLKPDYNNYNKRLVKTPKLYFYDVGLVCSLLGIRSFEQLETHYLRGSLFENLVINEFMKSYFNRGQNPDLYFWRDNVGNEIDLIDYRDGKPHAYEIKSGATFSKDYFKGLTKWASLSSSTPDQCSLIYQGPSLETKDGKAIGWK